MIRKIVTVALSLIALTVVLMTMSTGHATPTQITYPNHTPAPTMPACSTEDGAGQALCMWDAHFQGNGKGTAVVSGDCALDITGDKATQALCVEAHKLPSFTYETGNDGSYATQPNGADLVQECNDDAQLAKRDKNVANEMRNDGWTLAECYKAWLE